MPAELKCTVELAHKIAGFLAHGSYWEPACVASGISYPTVRRWIQQAAKDEDDGIEDSVFIRFRDILDKATADAETGLVRIIAGNPDDWRAQAFILERRHRERWGKQEQTVNQVNVVVSDQLVSQLADALAVARSNSSAITVEAESIRVLPFVEEKQASDSVTREACISENTPQDLGVTKA